MLRGEPRAQVSCEERVEAVDRRGAVDAVEEHVGGGEPFQQRGTVAAGHQRLAELGFEGAQDAGAQEELAHFGVLGVEDVLGEKVRDQPVGAGEIADEAALIAGFGEDDGGQAESHGPAFGLAVQAGLVGLVQVDAAGGGEEGASLLAREAEGAHVEFEHFAGGAQAGHGEVGDLAAADDQAAMGRQGLDQPRDQGQHGILVQGFEIVEE